VWLSNTAKEYWQEIGGLLLQMKLISYGDSADLMLRANARATPPRPALARKKLAPSGTGLQ
jgi:hypothetical protein